MSALERLLLRFRAWQRRRVIDRIRGQFAAFGYDVSHMTDDEIESANRRMSETVRRRAGYSLEEVTRGMDRMGAILRRDIHR